MIEKKRWCRAGVDCFGSYIKEVRERPPRSSITGLVRSI